jgi:hypothetical protein
MQRKNDRTHRGTTKHQKSSSNSIKARIGKTTVVRIGWNELGLVNEVLSTIPSDDCAQPGPADAIKKIFEDGLNGHYEFLYEQIKDKRKAEREMAMKKLNSK